MPASGTHRAERPSVALRGRNASDRAHFDTLDELDVWLAERERETRGLGREAAAARRLSIVRDLVGSSRLAPLLRHVSRTERELAAVAARSYAHVNGYDKVLLIDRRPAYALHLHIWWPETRRVEPEHIHDHPWDFGAVVWMGAYRHGEYAPDDSGMEFQTLHCRYEQRDTGHWLRPRGVARLRCVASAVCEADSGYTLRKEVLHRVEPARLTASVMLHGPVQRSDTSVFATVGRSSTERVVPAAMDRAALRSNLEQLLDALSHAEHARAGGKE